MTTGQCKGRRMDRGRRVAGQVDEWRRFTPWGTGPGTYVPGSPDFLAKQTARHRKTSRRAGGVSLRARALSGNRSFAQRSIVEPIIRRLFAVKAHNRRHVVTCLFPDKLPIPSTPPVRRTRPGTSASNRPISAHVLLAVRVPKVRAPQNSNPRALG